MERFKTPVILFLLYFSEVFSSEVPSPTAASQTSTDCTAQDSIKEMMTKLETVVTQRVASASCFNPEEPPKPCFDVTSSQSVISQLCDRIKSLESKISGLAPKETCKAKPNHNGNDEYHNMPYTQIAKLKEEIAQIKRSAVFYASRKIGNFTEQRVSNYNATVNSGTSGKEPFDPFDPASGIFLTPFEGVYHFSLSYQKSADVSLEARVVVDNSIIATTSDEGQQKIDLMTSLKSGQLVWTDINNTNIPTDSEVSIVFSGFFVH
ncbi:hypothetical protein BsWGS_24881 [Bradybaena similaris]